MKLGTVFLLYTMIVGTVVDAIDMIDFSQFSAGDWVRDLGDGVTVTVRPLYGRTGGCFTGGPEGNAPMIFDSSNPTGGDNDLGSPHKNFGGPGRGAGGKQGKAGENSKALGNLLIISEDCNTTEPDDSLEGGEFRFKFDNAATVGTLGLLDFSSGGRIHYSTRSSGSLSFHSDIVGVGNNGFQVLELNLQNIDELTVSTDKSGGIAYLDPAIGGPLIDCLSSITDPDKLLNGSTAQGRAYNWMKSQENIQSDIVSKCPLVQQLYILAVFRFSMSGTYKNWLSSTSDYGCSWDDVSCSEDGKVAYIWVQIPFYGGTLPPEMGSLSDMVEMYVPRSNLRGTIPTEIGKLAKLEALDLSSNRLTGTLPTEMGNMISLQSWFSVANNFLRGTIPTELNSIPNVRAWDAYFQGNSFSGTMPFTPDSNCPSTLAAECDEVQCSPQCCTECL